MFCYPPSPCVGVQPATLPPPSWGRALASHRRHPTTKHESAVSLRCATPQGFPAFSNRGELRSKKYPNRLAPRPRSLAARQSIRRKTRMASHFNTRARERTHGDPDWYIHGTMMSMSFATFLGELLPMEKRPGQIELSLRFVADGLPPKLILMESKVSLNCCASCSAGEGADAQGTRSGEPTFLAATSCSGPHPCGVLAVPCGAWTPGPCGVTPKGVRERGRTAGFLVFF
mmetsp:Transcript_40078/g.78512  ORF Transcript_40078/g.78512 Transcript_40078/m.78512 type:complete len:230 (-) Transcript_40078:140-829(-)